MSMTFTTYHTCATAWMSNLLSEYFAATTGYPLYQIRRDSKRANSSLDGNYPLFVDARWELTRDRCDRMVQVVRNPLAILAAGCFSHLHALPVDQWPTLAVQHHRLRQPANDDHEADLVREPTRVLTIRFEDLVMAPESAFGRIFTHFGECMPWGFAEQLMRHPFRETTPRLADERTISDANPYAWTDRLTHDAAETIYLRNRDVLDLHYPEVARLFQTNPSTTSLLYDFARSFVFGARAVA